MISSTGHFPAVHNSGDLRDNTLFSDVTAQSHPGELQEFLTLNVSGSTSTPVFFDFLGLLVRTPGLLVQVIKSQKVDSNEECTFTRECSSCIIVPRPNELASSGRRKILPNYVWKLTTSARFCQEIGKFLSKEIWRR